ncbi:P-loop NTPase fold protein [Halobacteriovorax sp. YZS-1-1]|uniref:P-loop NTPase fold protein n=1 Tax=unclassified Halobacteriovorax TaxID=2639665 RepID=UPI00399A8AAE
MKNSKYQFPNEIPNDSNWHLPSAPIQDSSQDELHHNIHSKNFAKLLVQVLNSNQGQTDNSKQKNNTIALLGDYGVGKSSIHSLLLKDNSISSSNLDLVHLTAWKYESGDLRIALLRKIHLLMYCRTKGWDNNKIDQKKISEINNDFEERLFKATSTTKVSPDDYSFANAFKNNIAALKGTFITVLIAFGIYIVLILLLTQALKLFGLILESQVIIGNISLTLIFLFFLYKKMPIFFEEQIKQWSVPPKKTKSQKPNHSSEALEVVFHDMVSTWFNSTKKSPVFFIDDIDRLQSTEIIHSLNSLRSFMEVGDCLFVVTCDERKIKKSLAELKQIDYKDNVPGPTSFDDFVQRYFPHSYRLPPFEKRDMKGFAIRAIRNEKNNHILRKLEIENKFPLEEIIDVLIHDGVKTPRQVGRLVNEFCNSVLSAFEMEKTHRLNKGTVTSNPWFLARITVLKMDFSWSIPHIQNNPDLLSWIATIERDGRKSLEPEELEACEQFYENEKPHQDYEKFITFVSKTYFYSTTSSRPFIFLNEYAEGGLGGDALYRLMYSSLTSGQAAQINSTLKDSEEDEDRLNLISSYISDIFEERSLSTLSNRNIIHTVVNIFSKLSEKYKSVIANKWASLCLKYLHDNELVDEHENIKKIVDILKYVSLSETTQKVLSLLIRTDEQGLVNLSNDQLLSIIDEDEVLQVGKGVDYLKTHFTIPLEEEDEELDEIIFWANQIIENDYSQKTLAMFNTSLINRFNTIVENTSEPEENEESSIQVKVEQFLELRINLIEKLWSSFTIENRTLMLLKLFQARLLKTQELQFIENNIADMSSNTISQINSKLIEQSIEEKYVSDTTEKIDLALKLSKEKDLSLTEAQISKLDSSFKRSLSPKSFSIKKGTIDALKNFLEQNSSTGLSLSWKTMGEKLSIRYNKNDKYDSLKESQETIIPFFLNNNFDEETQKSTIAFFLSPIDENTTLIDKDKEIIQNFLKTPSWEKNTQYMLEEKLSDIATSQSWDKYEAKVDIILSFKNSLSEGFFTKCSEQINTYLVTHHAQTSWISGASTLYSEFICDQSDEIIKKSISEITRLWAHYKHPANIDIASLYKKTWNKVVQSEEFSSILINLFNLTKAHPQDSIKHTNIIWPHLNENQRLELISLYTNHDITNLYSEISLQNNSVKIDEQAETIIQLARKYNDCLNSYLEQINTSCSQEYLEKLSEKLFERLADDWNNQTDIPISKFTTKWAKKESSNINNFFSMLSNGAINDIVILSSSLEAISFDLNSSQIQILTRKISKKITKDIKKENLTNILANLKKAKLIDNPSIIEKREVFKKSKESSDEMKEKWEVFKEYVPAKSMMNKLTEGVDNLLS